jgi:hypothetical protein
MRYHFVLVSAQRQRSAAGRRHAFASENNKSMTEGAVSCNALLGGLQIFILPYNALLDNSHLGFLQINYF